MILLVVLVILAKLLFFVLFLTILKKLKPKSIAIGLILIVRIFELASIQFVSEFCHEFDEQF